MDNRIPLKVIALSNEVEECIRNNIVKGEEETRVELSSQVTSKLMDEIARKETWCLSHGFKNTPIICRPDIRLYFRRLIERKFPRMKVLSYLEITPDYKLDVISIISFNDYSSLSET
jgi:flagellar biosynthesis component FlhA